MNIKAINYDNLSKKKFGKEKIIVGLPLDKEPEEDWRTIFEEALKTLFKPKQTLETNEMSIAPQTPFEITYPVSIEEDKDVIKLVTDQKNIHSDIAIVRRLVETVNERVDLENKKMEQKPE